MTKGRSTWLGKTRRVLALGTIGCVVGLALFAGWRIATHNIGVVQPGVAYRSAQLDAETLAKLIGSKGIKTVINLRGENDGSPWYRNEIDACRKLGVLHVDVRWSAKHLPPPAEVDRLLEAFRNVPRPILLHCQSGSDRTGLASSIFLIDQENVPWHKAAGELSWQYGHFPIYPYFEMDEFVQLYGQSHAKSMDEYVREDYPAIYASEMKQTKTDEMLEPFELAIKGSL